MIYWDGLDDWCRRGKNVETLDGACLLGSMITQKVDVEIHP